MYSIAFFKVEFSTALIYVISEKNPQKRLVAAPSDQLVHGLDITYYLHKFFR
jgi:hypothetical protein